MIVCPNCQEENRLGAIFCRNCGTKLAIDDVNVQNFEERTGVVAEDKVKKKARKKKRIYKLVFLLFLAGVVTAVILAIQKSEFPELPTSSEAYNAFQKKLNAVEAAIKAGRPIDTVRFTEEELNSYIQDAVNKTESKGTVKIDSVFIDLQDDNKVMLYFIFEVFGRKLYATYNGTVESGDGALSFTPDGAFAARLGKLPYPTFLFNMQAREVAKNQKEILDTLGSISEITITDGEVKGKLAK